MVDTVLWLWYYYISRERKGITMEVKTANLTKTQIMMVKLALYNGGFPVADRKFISDGFDYQWPGKHVLYYNVANKVTGKDDTKVMTRDIK